MKPSTPPMNWLVGALVALTLLQLPVAAQASWNDAEHRIDVTQTPRAFDRSTRTIFSYVTLTNASDSVTLTGPFRLVVPTSTINGNAVDVTNKDGDTTGSEPYLDLSEASFAPGESVTLRVEFPLQRGALAFTTRAEIFHTETTFTVTRSTSYGGSGSIAEAIDLANGNPGCDIIELTPGLQVDAGMNDGPIGQGFDYVLSRITECVTIDGKGGALLGTQTWFNQSGNQTFTRCPTASDGVLILAVMPGFVNIGTMGQDNTGIDVTIRDLTLRQFNHVAQVYENASLLMEDVTVNETWSTYRCDALPIITALTGATVTLRDSTFAEYYNWRDAPEVRAAAFVGSDAGDLTIERCLLQDLLPVAPQPGIFWVGAPGSQINIVSTLGDWARGIHAFGDAETNIVNSLWMNRSPFDVPDPDDGLLNGSSGDMNIIASTFFWNFDECDLECRTQESIGIPTHYVDRFGTGLINIRQSAIGFNLTGGAIGSTIVPTLVDNGTGGFTADEYTWIEPTSLQGATELIAITGQNSLLTGSPAFNTPQFFVDPTYMQRIGTPTTGGVLINQVPDADTVNELINPIDNTVITEDVFGNPRVDGTTRNIGAVQDDALPTPP